MSDFDSSQVSGRQESFVQRVFRFPSVFHQHNYITANVKTNFDHDADSGLASVDTLLSGSPSFSSNPSLSYHTLPLDEPLEPPLTPPQLHNKKSKQMIPCVEERHFPYSKLRSYFQLPLLLVISFCLTIKFWLRFWQ